jgi:hypothetical protein
LFVCFTWKSTFPFPKPGLPFSIALIKCILFKWNVLRVSALSWPGVWCPRTVTQAASSRLPLHPSKLLQKTEGLNPTSPARPSAWIWPQGPRSNLNSGQTPGGSWPAPLCQLKQQLAEAEAEGAENANRRDSPSQVTFPSGLWGPSVAQTMNGFSPKQHLVWRV